MYVHMYDIPLLFIIFEDITLDLFYIYYPRDLLYTCNLHKYYSTFFYSVSNGADKIIVAPYYWDRYPNKKLDFLSFLLFWFG